MTLFGRGDRDIVTKGHMGEGQFLFNSELNLATKNLENATFLLNANLSNNMGGDTGQSPPNVTWRREGV